MMSIQPRVYNGASDLARIQAFMAEITAEAGQCGMLHPGDVPHRIYNVMRKDDPAEIVRLWEDGNGKMMAWALLYPRFKGVDIFLRPELWESQLAAEVLETSEAALRDIMMQRNLAGKMNTDVWNCDQRRTALVERHGWQRATESIFTYTTRSLDLPIPPLQLREGFTIRSARGVEEAEALAAVHRGGFGSDWTGETYAKFMLSPGYEPERELVVIAPDGQFAAFCVIWFDPVNKVGLFEPVATHSDFRQMGLGKQLLYEAMRRMKASGMERACVTWEGDNDASQGLYKSVGFVAQHEIYSYEKL